MNQRLVRITIEAETTPTEQAQPIDGYVYCLSHTEVHEDSSDPYGEGYGTCMALMNGSGVGITKDDVHRPMLWEPRRGDLA